MNEQRFTQQPGYHYIAYSPEDAYASEKQWPLIIFLHGIGERGNDLNLVAGQALPRMLGDRRTFPFVTVAPQCPENEYWIPPMVDELVPQVASLYKNRPRPRLSYGHQHGRVWCLDDGDQLPRTIEWLLSQNRKSRATAA